MKTDKDPGRCFRQGDHNFPFINLNVEFFQALFRLLHSIFSAVVVSILGPTPGRPQSLRTLYGKKPTFQALETRTDLVLRPSRQQCIRILYTQKADRLWKRHVPDLPFY